MNLLKIAQSVREAFEDIALHESQNPNVLAGYCYRASSQLLMAAQELGFDLSIASAPYHVFNIFEQGERELVLDVTATQFDVCEKVFVCEWSYVEEKLKHWNFFHGEGVFDSVQSFFDNTSWSFPYACLISDRIFVSERLEIPRALPEEIDRKVWEKYNECSSRILRM